jgi:tetratricopeptide (TPR) repeat protein
VSFNPSKKVARIRICVLALFALIGFTRSIQGASFDDANKLYYEGKFSEAANAYEKLAQTSPPSPALYFNLGNALFKGGQVGRAISAYHQAERFNPRDPDVRANLQFARNQTQGPTLTPQPWQRSLAKLSLNEWTLLASGSVWIWLLLIAARQWRPSWNRNLRGLVIGWSVVCAIFCGCLAVVFHEARSIQSAVVIAPEAIARHGPLDESMNAFTLHDGAEVRVLDRKDDWLLVTTDPRRTGWLRSNQVLLASK